MSITKPMLAVAVKNVADIKFPVLATPKLDGIRCIKVNGQALSRKFKPIPNHHIRNLIEEVCPDGFDGEIMAGKTFNECQSLVMSEDGEPDFRYVVFDYVAGELTDGYSKRIDWLQNWMEHWQLEWTVPLYPVLIQDIAELDAYEAKCLADGYEGVMLRLPSGPYKCNRSTLKEGYLLKLKRFADAEAKIIGFEELMHNNNPAEIGELGQTKRSHKKENLVPANMMGVMLVKDIKTGVEFGLGTGFTAEQRRAYWLAKELLIGKTITYTYQESGMKDKPRFPSFKGFRHEDDMSDLEPALEQVKAEGAEVDKKYRGDFEIDSRVHDEDDARWWHPT